MTTRTTTVEHGQHSLRNLIGATALTALLVTGAAIKLERSTHDSGLATSSAATPTVVSSIGRVTVAPLTYLVGSAEQQLAVQAALDEANAIRHAANAGPLSFGAHLVTSDEQRDTVMGAIAEQNSVRATLGLAPVQVQDLRGAIAAAAAGGGTGIGRLATAYQHRSSTMSMVPLVCGNNTETRFC